MTSTLSRESVNHSLDAVVALNSNGILHLFAVSQHIFVRASLNFLRRLSCLFQCSMKLVGAHSSSVIARSQLCIISLFVSSLMTVKVLTCCPSLYFRKTSVSRYWFPATEWFSPRMIYKHLPFSLKSFYLLHAGKKVSSVPTAFHFTDTFTQEQEALINSSSLCNLPW